MRTFTPDIQGESAYSSFSKKDLDALDWYWRGQISTYVTDVIRSGAHARPRARARGESARAQSANARFAAAAAGQRRSHFRSPGPAAPLVRDSSGSPAPAKAAAGGGTPAPLVGAGVPSLPGWPRPAHAASPSWDQ